MILFFTWLVLFKLPCHCSAELRCSPPDVSYFSDDNEAAEKHAFIRKTRAHRSLGGACLTLILASSFFRPEISWIRWKVENKTLTASFDDSQSIDKFALCCLLTLFVYLQPFGCNLIRWWIWSYISRTVWPRVISNGRFHSTEHEWVLNNSHWPRILPFSVGCQTFLSPVITHYNLTINYRCFLSETRRCFRLMRSSMSASAAAVTKFCFGEYLRNC